MVDFTGGCSEIFDLNRIVPKDLFTIMQKSYKKKSLNCSSIAPDPHKFEAKTELGLIRGHAYSIIKVVKGSHNKNIFSVIGCESQDCHKQSEGADTSCEGSESLGE